MDHYVNKFFKELVAESLERVPHDIKKSFHANLAHLAEQHPRNVQVLGSSPRVGSFGEVDEVWWPSRSSKPLVA